jgi:hypothetical protein
VPFCDRDDRAATAVGRLYDTSGNALTPGLLRPRERGSAGGVADRYRDMRFLRDDHVEAQAAALMRQRRLTHAVLYINTVPCAYPDGCARNIRDVIPKGSTLTVYRVYPSGAVQPYNYRGNGRGLEGDV